jgi:biotin operon repressor
MSQKEKAITKNDNLEVVSGQEVKSELDIKREEAVKKINAILEEYQFDLGVVGFSLIPKVNK